jgi:hypothetical protein
VFWAGLATMHAFICLPSVSVMRSVGPYGRCWVIETQFVYVKPATDKLDGLGRFYGEVYDGSLRGRYRVFYRVGGVERPQPLNQQRKNVAVLFIQRDGLPLDRSYYFPGLGKVGLSVGVMGIFDEMRCDLAALLKIYLGLSSSCGRDIRRGENSNSMPEIRERNK